MEAAPPPAAAPPISGVAAAAASVDSVDSSPRSRTTDSWDEPLMAVPGGSKLRLMCSYGGHIVPRPHDKSLCYVGGDTRIVVVDRHTSLLDLSCRLSKTLLNGRPFIMKYQLPNEDLDSLISVTTDEDLENMVEEYDRLCSSAVVQPSSLKYSRIRLFLFQIKPESASSIGSFLDGSHKSGDWFLNALNGGVVISRGFSDSAVNVNCLLGLEGAVIGSGGSGDGGELDNSQGEFGAGVGLKNAKQSGQDVHSVPDSPMLETSSSFGSTSSSPSLANLPPIRVHVEDAGGARAQIQDQKLGIEEQFAQISVASGQKQEEGFVVLSSPPPIPTTISAGAVVSAVQMATVFSDDDRSEQGIHVGSRRPPQGQPQPQTQQLPQSLPLQSQQKPSGTSDLPSPDSLSRDSCPTNAIPRQKLMIYQDQVVQMPSGTSQVSLNPVDPKISTTDPTVRVQMQQVQEPGYLLQSQLDQQQQQQQQYIHGGPHYIHHHPAGAMPISTYYPVYPSQQQHPHHHHQLDQQYPVYYLPARPAQTYNLQVQPPSFGEAPTAIPSNRPPTPPNPTLVARNAPQGKPEMASGVHRAAAPANPTVIQVPGNQHQQQYVGFAQHHHPSQSFAPNPGAATNYGYEFADPAHAHVYYTQPLAPTMPSQYQTMSSAPMVISEASTQPPTDNAKQQTRTTQAL